MARLNRGEDAKIDAINDLVAQVIENNGLRESSLSALLELFHPLILKLCNKWSTYFDDTNHKLIPFDELIALAQYWFMQYTINSYKTDGPATYNKFIKDHIDQRIRYIYECELKYRNKLIFPDPYSSDCEDGQSVFDEVVNKYTDSGNNIEDDYVDNDIDNSRSKLVGEVLDIINSDVFNDRERDIFMKIVCNECTHEQMGIVYNISRTRVTQILAKAKSKLYKRIEKDSAVWQLLDDAGIDVTNPKLME